MIKHTRFVTGSLEASGFLQRVYNLLDTYIHHKIIVIVVGSEIFLTDFEIKGIFEFEHLRTILKLNSYETPLTCTVKVTRRND